MGGKHFLSHNGILPGRLKVQTSYDPGGIRACNLLCSSSLGVLRTNTYETGEASVVFIGLSLLESALTTVSLLRGAWAPQKQLG